MISQKLIDRAGTEAPTVDRIVLQVRTGQSVPFSPYMTGKETVPASGSTTVPFPTFMTPNK